MDARDKKIKPLVIAEAANPEWVSVPLVGWSHAEALSRLVDAHVVTQVRNRAAIERFGWRHGVEFTALDSEGAARPMWRVAKFGRERLKLGWTLVTATQALAYYQFESLVWREFGERIRAGEFDLVHRITPLSPTTPSILASRCRGAGVPFILGPLNGSVPWPKEFREAQHREGEFLSYARSAYKLLPASRSTRKAASAILVGSRAVWNEMPSSLHEKCVYMPENAVDPARFNKQVDGPLEGPLRVCFIGRLVPYKGADMLIEAAAELCRAGKLRLDIVGDGPEMKRLETLVASHDLGSMVELAGWVDHKRVQDRLVQSEVFAFPSVREFGGGVALEAMALGLVPVVLDYAGPAELVTEDTGFKVPMGNRQDVIDGFRSVLEELSMRRADLPAIGRRARKRVFDLFTWDAKARHTRDVYRWVLGRESTRPTGGLSLRIS
jgi:glycosyltransferase involved in cell wall biosynthesis